MSNDREGAFDPYHKWLGIAPERRPINHYILLGISRTEKDTEVIEDAAIRQSAHVRTYQLGPHAEACQRLLTEIAQARRILLDTEKRKEYDATLPKAKRKPAVEQPTASSLPRSKKSPPRSQGVLIGSFIGGGVLVIALIAVVILANQPAQETKTAMNPASSNLPPKKPMEKPPSLLDPSKSNAGNTEKDKKKASQPEKKDLPITKEPLESDVLKAAPADLASAIKTLESTPEDAKAHEKVGRWLVFSKGAWKMGLPHLARGDDKALSGLAKKELAKPSSVSERIEVADTWHDFDPEDRIERAVGRGRSLYWYRLAAPDVSGAKLAHVKDRLAELESLGIDLAGQPLAKTPSNWTVVFRSHDPSIWGQATNRGPNDYSVDFAKFPSDGRFLRIINTDTGDEIISMVKPGVWNNFHQSSPCGGWQAKAMLLNAHHLGIWDYNLKAAPEGDVPLHVHAPSETYLSGWGFGHIRGSGGQGYVWAGKPIPRTAFEIAISPGPISPADGRKMVSPLVPLPDTDDWIVLFRSSDPKLWGRTVLEGPEAYAVSPLSAPSATRFLKLTNMKNRDSVIVDVTRDRLLEASQNYNYGWVGSSYIIDRSVHLGIYSKSLIRPGQICVHEPARESFRGGWGLGHPGWVNNQPQGYSWDDVRVDPFVFEIAVKTGQLTPQEQEKLLQN